MEDDPLRLLTIEEVIALLRISKATLHNLMVRGEIVPVKIGGRTLFTRKEVERFIEQQTGVAKGKKRGRKPKNQA